MGLNLNRILIVSFVLMFFFFCNAELLEAQTSKDTFIMHLKAINGDRVNDSINAFKAIVFKEKSNFNFKIDDEKINQELNRIEKVSDRATYLDLAVNHIITFIDSKDTNTQNILIQKGTSIVDKFDHLKDENFQFIWIYLLRELRKPYRNGKYIYDGIEYFGKKTNQYKLENDKIGLTITYNVLSTFNNRLGLIDKAEYYQLKSIEVLDPNVIDKAGTHSGLLAILNRYSVLGSYFIDNNNYTKAQKYLSLAINHLSKLDTPTIFSDVAYLYLQYAKLKGIQKSDSALYFFNLAEIYHHELGSDQQAFAYHVLEKGIYFLNIQSPDSAFYYLKSAKQIKDSLDLGISSQMGELIPNYFIAKLEFNKNNPKKAIELLLPEIEELKTINARKHLLDHLTLLAACYENLKLQNESIAIYKEIIKLKTDISNDVEKARTLSYESEKKTEEDNKRISQLQLENDIAKKTKNYLYGIVGLMCLLAFSFVAAYITKQKNNKVLNKRNMEMQLTLSQLKSTQAQLIQAEKMASLGELTAGIAHEIQNPLNFVNNFSEVNIELLGELKDEILKKNLDEVNAIAEDIISNEEKINHHGKRADAIVKGMLQHSRKSTGQKEPTDINALCDEYLRLSYHGLRAKDKSFYADYELMADENMPTINVIPQDMGRVLLNIINNAFYACAKKAEMEKGLTSMESHYKPKVKVTTSFKDDNIEIIIQDNGIGIPQNMVDKIFQPFFTTKPTGQGTGLGLSLSYDIVRAHGGRLEVKSKEGEMTEFMIIMPIS